MKIPRRCVLCGTGLDAWDRYNLLWGECNDCRDWQAYLWQRRPPHAPEDVAWQRAMIEGLTEKPA
jgi:hypothetical protein